MSNDYEKRLADITNLLALLPSSWRELMREVEQEKSRLTMQLIAAEDPETRGRIKALIWLQELPELLRSEQSSISAALSDSDAA